MLDDVSGMVVDSMVVTMDRAQDWYGMVFMMVSPMVKNGQN